jgi:hypothetical protein
VTLGALLGDATQISGTAERPRLAVFRANKHMHAQVIDDLANDGVGHTMAHMSTLNKELATALEGKTGDIVSAATPPPCVYGSSALFLVALAVELRRSSREHVCTTGAGRELRPGEEADMASCPGIQPSAD